MVVAALSPMENPHVWEGKAGVESSVCCVCSTGRLPGLAETLGVAPQAQSHLCGFRCFCFSMFSLFSCLLACLWDLLLSRVADEAFYKQPFADVIGYVYVAKLIPFLV